MPKEVQDVLGSLGSWGSRASGLSLKEELGGTERGREGQGSVFAVPGKSGKGNRNLWSWGLGSQNPTCRGGWGVYEEHPKPKTLKEGQEVPGKGKSFYLGSAKDILGARLGAGSDGGWVWN